MNVPAGTPEPDTRVKVIQWLIDTFGYKRYLEIGCNLNFSFDPIVCAEKTGIDPVQGGTHRCTSDQFFAACPAERQFDVVFIDGLHWSVQVDRDIANSLAHLAPGGTIVLHDCDPQKEIEQIYPNPPGQAWWNGDVWKAIVKWRTNPDVDIVVTQFDCGCGVLRKRPNTDALKLPPGIASLPFTELTWPMLVENRDRWLRKKPWAEIAKWVHGAGVL